MSRFEFSIKSTPGGHKQRERPKLVVIFFVCVSAYWLCIPKRQDGWATAAAGEGGGEELGN